MSKAPASTHASLKPPAASEPSRPRSLTAAMPHDAGIARWLLGLWLLVLILVLVGGLTRLTGSGLSMVAWHPLMGALPPVGDAAWRDVFAQYQQSPQFQQVNHWMALSDFKRIFLWEYVHRLLGRLVGVAFLIPFAYFLVRRRLSGPAVLRTGAAFLLGGAQGGLGWYMVQSGLVDRPQVSHLRLAAHLVLAFSVGGYLLWLALDASHRPAQPGRVHGATGGLVFVSALLWPLVGLQVVYGALMAGTGAGSLFATFPDMGGGYLPGPFFRFPTLAGNLLYSPLAIHWTHRNLGWVVLLAVVGLAVLLHRRAVWLDARQPGTALLSLTLVQIGLGAATVLGGVPMVLAAAHQVCAYLLFSAAIWLTHRLAGLRRQPISN